MFEIVRSTKSEQNTGTILYWISMTLIINLVGIKRKASEEISQLSKKFREN